MTGGALGKVQAYIGMTEEQFRLTLHAHILVWVHGYSSRGRLRNDQGASPKKDVELARGVIVLSRPSTPVQRMSLPARGYCSLNKIAMRHATRVSAVTHAEGKSGRQTISESKKE